MFLSGEKIKGERCMSAEGSNVKGSSQQSSISFPKVKEGGPLFSGPGPLITGGLVNDTTPGLESWTEGYMARTLYRDLHPPPTGTHNWKQYLPVTLLAAGNKDISHGVVDVAVKSRTQDD